MQRESICQYDATDIWFESPVTVGSDSRPLNNEFLSQWPSVKHLVIAKHRTGQEEPIFQGIIKKQVLQNVFTNANSNSSIGLFRKLGNYPFPMICHHWLWKELDKFIASWSLFFSIQFISNWSFFNSKLCVSYFFHVLMISSWRVLGYFNFFFFWKVEKLKQVLEKHD